MFPQWHGSGGVTGGELKERIRVESISLVMKISKLKQFGHVDGWQSDWMK